MYVQREKTSPCLPAGHKRPEVSCAVLSGSSPASGFRRIVLAVSAVCCLALCGCGASDRRQHVSGSVTLDGTPVESGSISFQPAAGNTGPSAGGLITKGQYDLPAQAGVMPGKYLVMIHLMRETGKMLPTDSGGLTPEVAPVTIKEAAGIEATVNDGGANTLDFQVHTAP